MGVKEVGVKEVENQIRDLVNWVAVKRQEEAQDVVTRIEPGTAAELVEKLDQLAVAVGKLNSSPAAKKKRRKKSHGKKKAKKKR